MKKLITLLILICLSFTMIPSTPSYGANTFKEGVYKLSDFNISPDNLYVVQNISKTDSVYLMVFDENQITMQTLRLEPNSSKYSLLPIKPNYRLVILGSGEVYLDLKPH